MSFAKTLYYVPASAVVSLAKSPYQVADGAALGQILCSKSPDRWRPACAPESLVVLKGYAEPRATQS